MTRHRHFVLTVASMLALAACGGSSNDPTADTSTSAPQDTVPVERISVAVAFYPIEDIVREIAGDAVEIVRLVEPGMPAHDAELTAAQLSSLSEADVVFYLGASFQPNVEKAIDSLPGNVGVDLFEADGVVHLETSADGKGSHSSDDHDHHAHGDDDPHIWLDPANMVAMTRAVAARLTTLAPEFADQFAANATAYTSQLETLGREIDTSFATCDTRVLVSAHDAFGYLAARAKLTTAAVTGINPQDEPSAKELEKIADVARDAKVSTVFFEQSLPADLSRAVADAIGASVDSLSTIETVSADALAAGETYVSIMRDNVSRIAEGLGCS